MKRNKIILSVVTMGLLLSGCNVDEEDVDVNGDTNSYTQCTLDNGKRLNLSDEMTRKLIGGTLTCGQIKTILFDDDSNINLDLPTTSISEVRDFDINGITTSPISIGGILSTNTESITVYVYDKDNNYVESITAVFNDGKWTATTSVLSDGAYKMQVVSSDRDNDDTTLLSDTYDILEYDFSIDLINNISEFPFIINGVSKGSINSAEIEIRSTQESVIIETTTIDLDGNKITQNRQEDKVIEKLPVTFNLDGTWNVLSLKGDTDYTDGVYYVSMTAYSDEGSNNGNKSSTKESNKFYIGSKDSSVVTETIIETVIETEYVTQTEYIDSDSTVNTKITGNSTVGTTLSGTVSDNITSMTIEVRDNLDSLVSAQFPTINTDLTWTSSSINLSDGFYSYSMLLNKEDGGELNLSNDFEVNNDVFVSLNQILYQTVGSFDIDGLVSEDMNSIVVSIENLSDNSITNISTTNIGNTYSVTTNNLSNGNYSVTTEVEDLDGNRKISNPVTFTVNVESSLPQSQSIKCVGAPERSVVDGYTVVTTLVYLRTLIIQAEDNGDELHSLKVCTSNLTNLFNLFRHSTSFGLRILNPNYIYEINNWDTSSVINMENLLNGAHSYSLIPNSENLPPMDYIHNFDGDISKWDTSNVTNMKGAFQDNEGFNGYIGDWDVSKVENMDNIFLGNKGFNQYIGDWDISNLTTMKTMFANSNYNQYLGNWDTSNVTDMFAMFSKTSYNQPLNNWDTSSVTNMRSLFALSSYNQPLNNWDTSSVTNMRRLFEDSVFNQPLNNWDTSSVTDMFAMFRGNKLFDQDIGSWNTSKVTTMSNMFSDTIFDQYIGDWDTSNVTSLYYMFGQSIFNQEIGNWDVSNVTTIFSLFSYNRVFNGDLSSWDVSSITEYSDYDRYDDYADSWIDSHKPFAYQLTNQLNNL